MSLNYASVRRGYQSSIFFSSDNLQQEKDCNQETSQGNCLGRIDSDVIGEDHQVIDIESDDGEGAILAGMDKDDDDDKSHLLPRGRVTTRQSGEPRVT